MTLPAGFPGWALMEQPDPDQILKLLGLDHLRALAIFSELSDRVIVDMLHQGSINQLVKSEYIIHVEEEAGDFQILLQGKLAYYKHCEDHHVLTRYFEQGEQMGFDEMIGLIKRDGTDVAVEDSLLLNVSCEQFYQLHKKHPGEFGIFMLNLSLDLAHEISILEDVIGKGTGWTRMN